MPNTFTICGNRLPKNGAPEGSSFLLGKDFDRIADAYPLDRAAFAHLLVDEEQRAFAGT